MRADGTLSPAEAEALRRMIARALATPRRAREWFAGRLAARAQRERDHRPRRLGLRPRRPDRVMIRGTRAVVVDYKFGRPRTRTLPPSGAANTSACCGKWATPQREGYLWYVKLGENRKGGRNNMNETIGIIPRANSAAGELSGRLHAPAARRAELPRAGRAAACAGAGARRPAASRAAGMLARAYDGAGLRLTAQFRAGGLRGRGGRDRPEVPARAVARPRRAQLHLRPLPHALAAASTSPTTTGGCRSSRRRTRPCWPATSTSSAWPSRRACSNPPPPSPPRRCCSCCCSGRCCGTRPLRRHCSPWRSSCPRSGSITGLVRNRINRYGELENKAQREKARLVAETFRGYADIEINNAFPMMLRSVRPGDGSGDPHAPARNGDRACCPRPSPRSGWPLGMALLVALSLGDGDGRAQMLFGVFAVAALRLMPSVRNIMTGWTAIKYNRYTIGILRDAAADCPPAPANPDCRDTPGPRSTSAATVAPGNSGNSGNSGNPGNPAADTASSPEKLPFRHEIAVRDLRFRFADGGRELFHGLSLTIRKGERIGIRGASGAGKTTLFNLLLGLYEPSGGEIAIDGTPLTAANRRAWQNRIGYVSQNLFIADGSFAANVALGIPAEEVDRGRVVMQALRAARLGELVTGTGERDRHPRRRMRLPPLGRTAPAHRHRPRALPAGRRAFLRRGDLGARQPHRRGDQPLYRRARCTGCRADTGRHRPPRKLARIL